jgi:hypothetical protein
MKLIIAGSRGVSPTVEELDDHIRRHFDVKDIECIISGSARGADSVGLRWAEKHSVSVKRFRPDWSKGKRAGILTNVEMAREADAAIVMWDGVSVGSKQMIEHMEDKHPDKKCVVIRISKAS